MGILGLKQLAYRPCAEVEHSINDSLEGGKIEEHSLNLWFQLNGCQSNKSSMCSFQVTSCSENVYMMAVLMGQSSSE